MKKYLLTLLLGCFFFSYSNATVHFIEVGSAQIYTPSMLTINLGDTVRFIWLGGSDYVIVSDDGAFADIPIYDLLTFDLILTEAGTYGFHDETFGAPGTDMYGSITVVDPDGIEEFLNGEVQLSAFPNPFSEVLSVSYEVDGIQEVELINMVGKTVKRYEVDQGVKHVNLQTSEIPSGIYMLCLKWNDNIIATRRVAKRK